MQEITKEEFYKIIYENDLDICVNSSYNNVTKIMFTKFTYRNGALFGVSRTNYDLDHDDYGQVKYELNN